MFKYNMGGSVPRETNIAGQRHSLAYINPFEEDLLNTQYRGGEGQPVPPFAGPGGVPTYIPDDGNRGKKKDPDANDPRGRDQRNTPRKEIKTLSPGGGPKSTPNIDRSGYKNDNRKVVQVSGTPINTLMPVTRDTAPTPAPTTTKQENSMPETLANILTGNDGLEYVGGTMRYGINHPKVQRGVVKAGSVVPKGAEENSFGFTAGMADSAYNNPGYTGPDSGGGIMGAISGIGTDLTMGYKAGLFSNRVQQRANLKAAGYEDSEIDAYFAKTDATIERNKNQPYVSGSGDDDNIIQELATEVVDPCPEGYKMDPETNACMIDPDIGMGGPVFTPSDPNAAVGGSSGYTQPMGNFIPTPLQPAPMNPMQQQLNALTSALQPKQNPQMQAGLGALPRRA